MKKTLGALGMLMYALNSCASSQPIEQPKPLENKSNISVEDKCDKPAPVRGDKPYGPQLPTREYLNAELNKNIKGMTKLVKEGLAVMPKVSYALAGQNGINAIQKRYEAGLQDLEVRQGIDRMKEWSKDQEKWQKETKALDTLEKELRGVDLNKIERDIEKADKQMFLMYFIVSNQMKQLKRKDPEYQEILRYDREQRSRQERNYQKTVPRTGKR
jgi:hypothetical protein